MTDELSTCSERSARLATAEAPYPVTQARISVDRDYLEVKLTDCEFMATRYPETFKRPKKSICEMIPIGMMVKIIVEWPLAVLPTERFWVEITTIERDISEAPVYFGELRNRTLLADYGETVGPIFPCNIADIDVEEFATKKGVSLETFSAKEEA